MTTLESCQIALAAGANDERTRARVAALTHAGANVRSCSLTGDLWAALSEAAFDALVVLLAREEPAQLVIYEQLRDDPRTRGLPMLLCTPDIKRSSGGGIVPALRGGSMSDPGALVLAADVDDAQFVTAVAALALPMRRLHEVEQHARSVREQLRDELARADQVARERADLSHELRAVLSAILGFGSNMRDEITGPLSADQRTHVAGILEAVDRAKRLLQRPHSGSLASVRTLSMPPASAPPRVQRSLVHLARVANEVTTLFEAVAARKAMRLRCSGDESVCVWGDALKLKQVVSNLLVNALKYTPEHGEVHVRVAWSNPSSASGASARRAGEITIADSGPGIAPEQRERVFKRGYRLERDAHIGGEGIGLAVVKEIVTQHGGSIAIETAPRGGALFRVTLPQDRRQRARSGELEGHAE